MVVKKEKREAVLYVKVKKRNKAFLRQEAAKKGYTTLSEYVDALVDEMRTKGKK